MGLDDSTKGNWKDHYGADGQVLLAAKIIFRDMPMSGI